MGRFSLHNVVPFTDGLLEHKVFYLPNQCMEALNSPFPLFLIDLLTPLGRKQPLQGFSKAPDKFGNFYACKRCCLFLSGMCQMGGGHFIALPSDLARRLHAIQLPLLLLVWIMHIGPTHFSFSPVFV